MPVGAAVKTDSIDLVVPVRNLRVSIDSPHRGDVVMYEYYGQGLPRGMVLLVQSRTGVIEGSVVSELELFQGPELKLLDEAQLMEESGPPGFAGLHYRLRIPPIERPMGPNGRIVERPTLNMIGDLYEDGGSICRLQVAWSPLSEYGPGSDELLASELQRAREKLELLRASVQRCGAAREE